MQGEIFQGPVNRRVGSGSARAVAEAVDTHSAMSTAKRPLLGRPFIMVAAGLSAHGRCLCIASVHVYGLRHSTVTAIVGVRRQDPRTPAVTDLVAVELDVVAVHEPNCA